MTSEHYSHPVLERVTISREIVKVRRGCQGMKGYKGMDGLSKLKGIVNVWRYCEGMTGLSRYEE